MSLSDAVWRGGAVVGLILLLAGLVALAAPGFAVQVPLGVGLVQLIGFGSALLSVWMLRWAYTSEHGQTVVPEVEALLATPPPGTEVDELLNRIARRQEGTEEYRERILERLTEVAIAVIRQQEDCSRAGAVEHLETGSWTGDALAANFFRPKGSDAESTSLVEQAIERVRRNETTYQRQLEATVSAIESTSNFDITDAGPDKDEQEPTETMDPDAIIGGNEESDEWVTDMTRYRSLLSTGQWTGIAAFTLAALAGGILASQPSLVVASAVGLAGDGYARAMSPPALTDVDVTRRFEDRTPEPGDEVSVTVVVENTGDNFLTDLRLVDRVPPTMRVVDGSVRLGTALRPGETASFDYTVAVERGKYDWPLQVIGRDISGSIERDALIDPQATLECVPELNTPAEMPVRLQTSVYAGSVDTRIGGEGLEFFSVRDYQPGDPKRRIDWKAYARSGEFSTVDYREEHAARVVLLFDGRESSYVSSTPDERHALDQSVDVALDVFASLYDQGHLVGIAGFNGIPLWLGPNTGTLHLQRVRNTFTEHPAISSLPPEATEEELGRYVNPMTHVRRQLPEDTQIFLFSPLTDDYTYDVARRLDGAGHLVTVVSPSPVAGRTIGQRLARLERSVLIKRLRDHGIRVIDWSDDESLGIALKYAKRRWEA